MAFLLSSSYNIVCLLLFLETTIGAFFNAIVMGIIIKGKMILQTGNIIRISLSTSNVLYSILVFASVSSGILGSQNVQITNPTLAYIVYSLNMFTLSSSSWLTAILSLFYFIKIVDLKVRAILWTKKNINAAILWMIMGVEVVALLSSFLSMLIYIDPRSSPLNESSLNNSLSSSNIGFLSTALIVSCAPFFIIVVTTVCMAVTLKKHSSNMMGNRNVKSFGNTVSKIKRLVLAYCLYFLCALLFYFSIAAQLTVQFWVFLLLLSSFTVVQSVLLVFGNPNLQKAAMEMLKCTACPQHMTS